MPDLLLAVKIDIYLRVINIFAELYGILAFHYDWKSTREGRFYYLLWALIMAAFLDFLLIGSDLRSLFPKVSLPEIYFPVTAEVVRSLFLLFMAYGLTLPYAESQASASTRYGYVLIVVLATLPVMQYLYLFGTKEDTGFEHHWIFFFYSILQIALAVAPTVILFRKKMNILASSCLLFALGFIFRILKSTNSWGDFVPFSFARDLLPTIALVLLIFATFRSRVGEVLSDFRQSIMDRATSLYNRRYFHHRLNEEIARAKRYKRNLSLIILNIDSFKWYIDRFGQTTCNTIIAETARLLLKNLRDVDTVVRYDEEEFALLLPETNKAGARTLGERIRAAIREQTFTHKSANFSITVSGGLASFPEDSSGSIDLQQKAYRGMYFARREGGNKVWEWRKEPAIE